MPDSGRAEDARSPEPRPAESEPVKVTGGAGSAGSRAPLLGRVGRILLLLFPQAPASRRPRWAAFAAALASLAAMAGGAWLLLARQPGSDFRYANPRAIARPWFLTVARAEDSRRADPLRAVRVLNATLPGSKLIGVSRPQQTPAAGR